MADYSPLGIQKIVEQAARDVRVIRCPRDSAVMRVAAARVQRHEGGKMVERSVEGLPRGRGWSVASLDLECPACRRQATKVELAPPVPISYPAAAARALLGRMLR